MKKTKTNENLQTQLIALKKVTTQNQENEKLVMKYQRIFTQKPNANSDKLTVVMVVAKNCLFKKLFWTHKSCKMNTQNSHKPSASFL